MIDGYEYQKQKRKEAKEYNKKHKDENPFVDTLFITIAITVLALILITVLAVITEKDNTIDCESIGGEYRVIDREWSAARKGTVDVYGCVK